MLLSVSGKFPFVRRHTCRSPAVYGSTELTKPTVPPSSRQWVKVGHGQLGHVVKHEPDGFVIELEDGSHVKRAAFHHAEPADIAHLRER